MATKDATLTVVIRGKRKSGKSTVAWAIMRALQYTGFDVSYEDPDEAEMPVFQGDRAKSVAKAGTKVVIVTDEAQRPGGNIR